MSRDLDLYKRPGEIHEYSSNEVMEMMKCEADVVYFMENYIKVQHPTQGSIPFIPYDYQRRMILSMQNNKDTIILSPRQTGKTTVIAIYLLWFAMFHDDKKILVASNKNKNAMDIVGRITFAYEELPMWLKPGVKSATAHRLTFDNGSEIDSQATTENTGRGAAVSLLLLDELAFVPKRMQEEMWASVAPTLSTGGGCVISSTPNGDNELFAHLWRGASLKHNSFHPIEVHWDEHPDRGEEYKKEMVGKVGELKWKQEYACEFVSSDHLLVSSLVLQNMRAAEPTEESMGFRFWAEFNPKFNYLVATDVSSGVGSDYSVIQVVESPTMKQVAEFRGNSISTVQLYGLIKWIIKKIETDCAQKSRKLPDIYWSFENNGVGESINALYENDPNFPESALLISNKDNKNGIVTTGKNKIISCMEFKNLVEKTSNGLIINSTYTIAEMKNYISKGKSYEAKPGATDDCIAAFLVFINMLKEVSNMDEDVYNVVYDFSESDEISDWAHDEPPPMLF